MIAKLVLISYQSISVYITLSTICFKKKKCMIKSGYENKRFENVSLNSNNPAVNVIITI
jgi:hypothetical protein